MTAKLKKNKKKHVSYSNKELPNAYPLVVGEWKSVHSPMPPHADEMLEEALSSLVSKILCLDQESQKKLFDRVNRFQVAQTLRQHTENMISDFEGRLFYQ